MFRVETKEGHFPTLLSERPGYKTIQVSLQLQSKWAQSLFGTETLPATLLGNFLRRSPSFPSHVSPVLPRPVSSPPRPLLPLPPPRPLGTRHQAGAGARPAGAEAELLLRQLEDNRSQLPLGVGDQLGGSVQAE